MDAIFPKPGLPSRQFTYVDFMDLNQVMQLANDPQVRQLLSSLFQQGKGQGLMSQLQQAGLGDQVQSWLSTGPNQPVTGQQIQQALGPHIDQAAAAAGMAPEEAAGDIAQVVPAVVNEASPNGQLDMGALQDILKQLTGARTP
jgi:uncharacterized protein YidB (DUF937 family)